MKTQMRFQKILILVSLIIAALSVLYAWIFCSGVFAQIAQIITDSDTLTKTPEIKQLHDAAQNFTVLFQTLGIVFVLCIVLLYIMGCHSRRNYYITNYVATGIAVVYILVYAILLIVNLTNIASIINTADFSYAKAAYDTAEFNVKLFGEFQTTSWTVGIGYALFAIVIVDAVLIGLNLLWKIKLMQGEKKLLENSIAEVA